MRHVAKTPRPSGIRLKLGGFMNSYLLTKFPAEVILDSCDPSDLMLLTKSKIGPVLTKYTEIFSGRGTLFNKLEEAQKQLPINVPNGDKLYALAPLNLLLWLHVLGLGDEKRQELYTNLAKQCDRLFKYWSGKGPRKINLSQVPIGRTMRGLITDPTLFRKPQYRSFGHLQGLIAALCCGVRDAKKDELVLCRDVLEAVAYAAAGRFSHVPVGKLEYKIYAAVYTEDNPAWNCALFQVVRAYELAERIDKLSYMAKEELTKNSRTGTRALSKQEFFIKLFTYAELSVSTDPLDSRRWIVLAGQSILW